MTASTPCPVCGGPEHADWRTDNTERMPTRGPKHPDAPEWARTPANEETK